MGRHSAPDDDEVVAADAAQSSDVLVEEAPRRGRHAAPEAVAETVEEDTEAAAAETGEAETGEAETVEAETLKAETAEADTVSGEAEAATTADTEKLPDTTADTEQLPHEASVPERTKRATNADLRMLRENPTLRARCAAAVIVPFVLYTVVLLVVGRTNIYLLWLWIPTVTAGIVAGAFMDRAARAAAEAPVKDEPAQAD